MNRRAATSEDAERGKWPSTTLPPSWRWLSFDDTWQNVTTSDKKLPQKSYMAAGALPVVDQGQKAITGFTDDASLRHPAPLPVIVFGDHTRCVKFVDFPFVQGADGVKVLLSRPVLNPRFGYHALRALTLPDKGYARQYKFLTATNFPVPPLDEQRRIVAKLEATSARSRRARVALEAVPPLLEKLRQSILAAAFRGDLTKDWRAKNKNVEPASALLDRIRAERRKRWEETEFARMKAKGKLSTGQAWKAKYKEPTPADAGMLPKLPAGWEWATWGEVGISQNGRAFPSTDYAAHGDKLLRPGNLHVSGAVSWNESNTRRMPPEWALNFPDFIVSHGELVMNLTAQSLKDEFLGRVCLTGLGERCLLNQRLARLTPLCLPPALYLWIFKTPAFRRYVDGLNTGSLIQHMFTSQLESYAVPLMPAEEADVLVSLIHDRMAALNAVEHALETHAVALSRLESSVLAAAMRGALIS